MIGPKWRHHSSGFALMFLLFVFANSPTAPDWMNSALSESILTELGCAKVNWANLMCFHQISTGFRYDDNFGGFKIRVFSNRQRYYDCCQLISVANTNSSYGVSFLSDLQSRNQTEYRGTGPGSKTKILLPQGVIAISAIF